MIKRKEMKKKKSGTFVGHYQCFGKFLNTFSFFNTLEFEQKKKKTSEKRLRVCCFLKLSDSSSLKQLTCGC